MKIDPATMFSRRPHRCHTHSRCFSTAPRVRHGSKSPTYSISRRFPWIRLTSATQLCGRSASRIPCQKTPPSSLSGSLESWAARRTFQPYAMAGALWFPMGAFSQPFQTVNARSYGYTVFPGRPTPAMLNHWASLQTHGKVQKIVQTVGQDDFVLATVVDFKSKWFLPFVAEETHPGDFTLLSGAKKPVRMMPKHNPEFQYLKGANFQAVKIGFYDAALVVVLPDEDSSLPAVVDALTIETWQSWSGQFGSHDGYLELPRFEISQQTDRR